MFQPEIIVLLATYNGERYLAVQLESLLKQTYGNWRLMIRDDNSTDGTPDIIEKYRLLYPSQIMVLPNNGGNAGSVVNFSRLLSAASEAAYIMFADQDDKWLPDKIEITFAEMMRLEAAVGAACPVLIFTDFLYVDNGLNAIASKKDFHVTRLPEVTFGHLLAQNHIYGCTILINRALANEVQTIPAEAENHDYWIALVASAFGKIFYLNKRTILYRQHSNNISGQFDNNTFNKRFRRILLERKNFKDASLKWQMLQVFKQRYYARLDARLQHVLNQFLALYQNKNPWLIVKNITNGVRSQTWHQSALLFATVFLLKKKK